MCTHTYIYIYIHVFTCSKLNFVWWSSSKLRLSIDDCSAFVRLSEFQMFMNVDALFICVPCSERCSAIFVLRIDHFGPGLRLFRFAVLYWCVFDLYMCFHFRNWIYCVEVLLDCVYKLIMLDHVWDVRFVRCCWWTVVKCLFVFPCSRLNLFW